MRLNRLTCAGFLMAVLLSVGTYAEVPVVESSPVSVYHSDTVAVSEPDAQVAVSQPYDANRTAYLFQVVEDLRQEIMSLRGQLEEQSHQISQIEADSKDRYVDLDKRISRFIDRRSAPASAGDDSSVKAGTGEAPSEKKISGTGGDDIQQERDAYQAAFALVKGKHFDDALIAMKKLLDDFPEGQYSDNAQYWLGEVQMAQGHYKEAKAEFLTLIKNYPHSVKMADASYKLGRVYYLLGDQEQAKKSLESVVSDYPGTTAARLSDTYLRSM